MKKFFKKVNHDIDRATRNLDEKYQEQKQQGQGRDFILNLGKGGTIDTLTKELDKAVSASDTTSVVNVSTATMEVSESAQKLASPEVASNAAVAQEAFDDHETEVAKALSASEVTKEASDSSNKLAEPASDMFRVNASDFSKSDKVVQELPVDSDDEDTAFQAALAESLAASVKVDSDHEALLIDAARALSLLPAEVLDQNGTVAVSGDHPDYLSVD